MERNSEPTIAYPEWTEFREKNGLDPLGMQSSSVWLYQSLLPGISNVTLRIRYYGYYAWLSQSYAQSVGDTNPKTWQRYVRRAEALYALVAQHHGGETGVAGVTWARKALDGLNGNTVDFADAAEPGSDNHYLKQAWGAYGAAYGSQLYEVGILADVSDHEIPVPSSDLDGVSISGGSLRSIWSEIAEYVALAELRYAFVEFEHFPYERLSEETISRALLPARAALLLDRDERSLLADWVVNTIVKDHPMGMFDLPVEIAKFAVDLIQARAGDTVYCPGPNNDMSSIAVMRFGAKPLMVGQSPPVLAALFACMTGKHFQFTQKDAYGLDVTNASNPTDTQLGIVFPPFGQRSAGLKTPLQMQSEFGAHSSEVLGVELALQSNAKRAIVIVPNSLLFKAGPEQKLRQYMIESGRLEAVVSFPSGLLANTNLPVSMLVIRPASSLGTVTFCKVSDSEHLSGHQGKLRSHDRRFTGEVEVLSLLRNPDGRTSISSSAADIRSQDYSLVPDRFLDKQSAVLESKKSESVLLGDIVSIVKPQLLPESKSDDGILVQEVSPGEMPEFGYLENSRGHAKSTQEYSRSAQTKPLRRATFYFPQREPLEKWRYADPSKAHRRCFHLCPLWF